MKGICFIFVPESHYDDDLLSQVSRLDKNVSSTFPGYDLITFSFKKNFLLHSVKLIFSEIKTKIQNMGPFVPIFS